MADQSTYYHPVCYRFRFTFPSRVTAENRYIQPPNQTQSSPRHSYILPSEPARTTLPKPDAPMLKSSEVDTLLSLEEEDRAVTKVEVDEVLSIVSYKGAEVATNDTVPGRTLSVIELESCQQ